MASVLLWFVETRGTRRSRRRRLRALMVGGVVLACLAAPFVQTLHPAEVIDDPAVMLVFLGVLVALSAYVTEQPGSPSSPAFDGPFRTH